MSWYSVRTRDGKPRSFVWAAAVLIAGFATMWLVYRVFLTIPVSLDGAPVRLSAGTRVSDLAGRLSGHPGDLVSVKTHRLLRRGQGEPAYVVVNGKRAKPDTLIHASDDVRGVNGMDRVEPTITRSDVVPAPVQYRGKGPLESVIETGVPGQREVVLGALSREVVSDRVVKEPVAQIVRREKPFRGAKVVALTFDDGPWPVQTERILSILLKYKVKATFFEIGGQARRRPALTKKLVDAGMLIGNHSESHPNMKHMDAAHVARQILQAQDDISKASGGKRPQFFRPPGGNVSPYMWPVLTKEHMKLVQWDVDTNDWKKPRAETIVARVLGHVHPGSVVLMHDGGGDRSRTIAALPAIIIGLQKAGYQLVTLDQMLVLPTKMG